ncbi:hypothetical protein Areg01_27200 [Actinoplanes regularis]|nr:hypothetical protein Areg01_27200 [Actinoplanes regularis]
MTRVPSTVVGRFLAASSQASRGSVFGARWVPVIGRFVRDRRGPAERRERWGSFVARMVLYDPVSPARWRADLVPVVCAELVESTGERSDGPRIAVRGRAHETVLDPSSVSGRRCRPPVAAASPELVN